MANFFAQLGSFSSEFGAEIAAYDPAAKELFVVSGDTKVEVLDISDPGNPRQSFVLDIATVLPDAGGINSVAIANGLLAIAIEASPKTALGSVALIDLAAFRANPTNSGAARLFTVGALPDMVTFTPDGRKVLVANEGEPSDDYLIDPEGSISIIDIASGAVTTAGFQGFNDRKAELIAKGVRIFGPNATVAQDLEPEYIAVSADGKTAFVTLQENNAFAVVDIDQGKVTEILPLGYKDHSLPGNQLDASDRDGGINLQNWPVFGMYQPDAIAAFSASGETYYITANEGDSRDYPGFSEEARVKDLILDPTVFPNAALLQTDATLGRLKTTTTLGDRDGDGDVDRIYAYGGRSFSIWDGKGNQVYDSGDDIARITAERVPTLFNSNGSVATFDSRSDDKGAEPEGVTIGQIGDQTFAFIGLERTGGILAYDVTNPTAPSFVDYIRPDGDISPEGLLFIPAAKSPDGQNLLVVTNEISNTISLFRTSPSVPSPKTFTLELLHAADQEAGIPALDDIPRFSAVLNALLAQDLGNDGKVDNTLVLSSGDAILPGLFFNASADVFGGPGRADILIQNRLGFQAIAFGNHEFDQGTALLKDLIGGNEADGFAGTAFPYLSGNLDFSTDTNLAGLVVEDAQPPKPNSIAASTILDVNGEKIGVVGATTPILRSISSPGGVTINPQPFDGIPTEAQLDALAAEIQADVDALLAANPEINKVILLAHMQQLTIEQALASRLRHVDIIVGGGSNTRLFDSNDRLREGDSDQGPYPIFTTDADGKPVAVVNTDGNYKYVGRLVVDFDENGVLIPESYDAAISGAYATDEQGVLDLNAQALVDGEIQAIVDQLREVINAKESNLFGVSSVYLDGRRGSVRIEETNLGNLTADANLALAKAADPSVVISLKNGGGIRDSIGRIFVPAGGTGEAELLPNEGIPDVKPDGGISETDVINTLRFNNGLSLITLTATELLVLMEHAVAASSLEDSNTQGRFPQISGFSFSFDLTQAPGNRVVSLAIEDETGKDLDVVVKNGEIQGNPERTFRMVTLGFLADGGDSFPFPTGEGANRVDLVQPTDAPRTGAATFAPDGSEQDALAEYLLANFGNAANAFSEAETPRELDTRIQNLTFREDTVIDAFMGGGTPLSINFDEEGLVAGTVVTNQFSGLTISAADRFTGEAMQAMIFDSANPTGGDYDLATKDQGNILIISEDGDSSNPDDNAYGGKLSFNWDGLVGVASVGLLDIEEFGGRIELFDDQDQLIRSVVIPALTDNSLQSVSLGANGMGFTANVSRMDVILAGSGAITDVVLANATDSALLGV